MYQSIVLALALIVISGHSGANTYRDYSTVLQTLADLENSYPNIVKMHDIGITEHGRTIRAIKISDNPTSNDDAEPDVLIVGAHHAREWISVEVPLRIAEYLASTYDTDAETRRLIDGREIWLIPLLNPDGYVYSTTDDRLWRKNRSALPGGFFGVDLNRNYDFEWGGAGSSGKLFENTYRGPSAFSEPETIAIKQLIENPNHQFTRLLSYHSYSELILYPWGYTKDEAEDVALLRTIAEEMRDLIESVHGNEYSVKQSAELYPTNGDLTDWAYGEKGILAFTIELPPAKCVFPLIPFGCASGAGGFTLDEGKIVPVFEENLKAALFFIGLTRGRVMNFEGGEDRQPIRSTIPGMEFTTTEGYDWIYGDAGTGNYAIPPYAVSGNVFAWLGENQGLGEIDFVGGSYKTVGLSYSSLNAMYLEAYDVHGNLVDADSGLGNTGTGKLDRLVVEGDIAKVIAHDSGNYWLIDDLFVTDALSEAQAQLPGKYSRPLEEVETYVQGDEKEFVFVNKNEQFLNIVLNWPGSEFLLEIFRPDGSLFVSQQSEHPPIKVDIPNAEAGSWRIKVKAIFLEQEEPAALVVGTYNPNDIDNDNVFKKLDNCPTTANINQEDNDGDGVGDVCDNCPAIANPGQEDVYPLDGPEGQGNGIGDACENIPADMDEDGVLNESDNCPTVPNPDQKDSDGNGEGDVCPSSIPIQIIAVDVKPGGEPNCIKVTNKGVVPIAILGSADFDITTIDTASLEIDGVIPKRTAPEDVNEDGFIDLIMHTKTQLLNDAGAFIDGGVLTVTGQLLDGTSITGADSINLAGGPYCY